MSDITENPIASNRRIAKNTILLYVRSIVMLLISLYTSRVILQTLGLTDYGIVGAVAGAVGMFSMVTSSFMSAVSRFITFELGKGKEGKLNRIFCSSVNVLLLLGVIVLIFGLTIGLWFLNTKMNIPPDRQQAAAYVMCCSLVAMVISIQVTPYTAVIIAHENMSVFAYMSIVEAVLKLAIVYMLLIGEMDKLILYAILQICVAVVMRSAYYIYCKKKYPECNYHFIIDKESTKEMFGFAGWAGLNSVVYTFNKQGVEILINMFFGVMFNAARSIAVQVEGVVNQFVGNFMSAMSPQITKLYASGNKDGMFNLICRGARFSYFLMLYFAIPVFFETETILQIWLGIYPTEAVLFIRLSLMLSLAVMLGNTLLTGCMAVGDIKIYSISASVISSLMFIVTYVLFKLGFGVESMYAVSLAVLLLMICIRLQFLYIKSGFPVMLYMRSVIIKCLLITLPVLVAPMLISSTLDVGILRLVLQIIIPSLSTTLIVYYFGLTLSERKEVISLIKNRLIKK